MNEETCIEMASGLRVARLSTVHPDGRSDAVPIVFAFTDGALVFTVDHKPKKSRQLQRLRNIQHQPEVTVLFDHYDDADWANLWWVRMRGTAAELPIESAESEQALNALTARYAQYTDRRPVGPVVQVTPTNWTGWVGSQPDSS